MPSLPRLLMLCVLVSVLSSFSMLIGSASAAVPTEISCIAVGPSPESCVVVSVVKDVAKPSRGASVLRAAQSYLGVPYAWGGEGRGGLDCSGLVVVSFRQTGRQLPHYSGALWQLGQRIPRKALRPGDLVFFRLSGGVPGHLGIYAGRGRYIHSPSSGDHVRYSLLSARADDYAGARRLR